MIGVMVIYQCNDGPVAYGPFSTVSAAVAWCNARAAKPGEDAVRFAIVPQHSPDYWPAPCAMCGSDAGDAPGSPGAHLSNL
jgi:hypothetical protein